MLFKVDRSSKSISPIKQTDLASQGFLETRHLEEWFASSTDILGRKLLWIARQDSTSDADRSDLIGIDKDSELLVVELKRGYVDMSVLTQALNYASQYAPLSPDEIIQLFIKNSSRQTATPLHKLATTEEEASRMMTDLTGSPEVNESQVLILVGTAFDPGVLAMCEYLNKAVGSDATVSAECWKVSLFDDANSLYLQLVQVLPTPDLQQQIEQIREERRATKYKRDPYKVQFMYLLKEKARQAGLQVTAKPGASYHCSVAIAGQPPIDVDIYQDLTIRVPKASTYNVNTLPAGKTKDDGTIVSYSFPSVSWEDETIRKKTADDLVSTITALQP